MSRLDDLIKSLCPDGVKCYNLGAIAELRSGWGFPVKEQGNKIAEIPFYKVADMNNSLIFMGEASNYVTHETAQKLKCNPAPKGTIIFPKVGATIRTDKKRIIVTDSCYDNNIMGVIAKESIVNSKYLYYYLSKVPLITFTKGEGAVPSISKESLSNFKLPIPPLEVQEEIVRLLDDFTAKTAELQDKLNEELEARKKQYEYYRNAILNGDKNAETVKLGDVCDFVRGPFGGALKKDSFVSSGYAVYEQQHAIYQNTNIRYFIDSKKYNDLIRFKVSPNDIIVSCSGTIGKTYIIPNDAPKGIINQALLKLTAHDCLNVRYLQYIFENNLVKIMNNNARGGAIKNVPSVKELKNIEIQLPSNDTQGRIINILDNLESTCDNLQTNISVEFESRQKQYEYYRDKLLTFKELNESEVN